MNNRLLVATAFLIMSISQIVISIAPSYVGLQKYFASLRIKDFNLKSLKTAFEYNCSGNL